MSTEPLTPQEVDALLKDPRSTSADMLVLRDALLRMGGALQRLADAVSRLQDSAEQLDRERGRFDRPVAPPPGRPPRAD